MIKRLNILILIYAIIFCLLLFSCSVSKPQIKEFTVIAIGDGVFEARNGKTTVIFLMTSPVKVGETIPVSMGRKKVKS